jgi:hypothetical protein
MNTPKPIDATRRNYGLGNYTKTRLQDNNRSNLRSIGQMDLTDTEIVRLCATAMDLHVSGTGYVVLGRSASDFYDPLHDDAQAMALVKKLHLDIGAHADKGPWHVWDFIRLEYFSYGPDLNRCICECVAKMQKEKK